MQSERIFKRILALLVCLALVLSYLPGLTLPARAEEAATDASTSVAEDQDFLSNATCAIGVIQSEVTNGSAAAWKLTKELESNHNWVYPSFILDKSYDISMHKLTFDFKVVGATSFRMHISKPVSEGGVFYPVDQWNTITIDFSQFEACPETFSELGFGMEFNGSEGNHAIYIDNVKLWRDETVAFDWIKLPVDAGSYYTTGEYELVTGLSVGGSSDQSMKLHTTTAKGAIGFNTDYAVTLGKLEAVPNMSAGTLSAWFYFGHGVAPSASLRLTFKDDGISNVVPFSFESKGNGWYFGSVDCSAINTTTGSDMSQVARVNIRELPANTTIYIDCLTFAQNGIDGLSIAYPYNTETYQQTEELVSAFDALTFVSARNEVESAQMILKPTFDISSYKLTMGDLYNANGNVIPADAFEVFAQHYVTVTGTGNGGTQITNPETGETFWNAEHESTAGPEGTFPNQLIPQNASIEKSENTVVSGNNQGIWVNLKVTDFAPGTYTGNAVLNVNGTDLLIPVSVTVYDVAVPEENHVKSSFQIWWDQLGYLLYGENEIQASDREDYINYLHSKRLMTMDYWGITRYDDSMVNKAVSLAQDPAISAYALRYAKAEDGNVDTEALTETLTAFINKNVELAQSGSNVDLFKKAYFYFGQICDEPRNEADYTLVNEVTARLDAVKAELAPMLADYPALQESFMNLKHLVTGPDSADETFSFINLQDYGDVALTGDSFAYVPQYQWLHTEEQRALYADEDEIWWYGCTHPVNPYPSLSFNSELLTSRALGFMMYDYNVDGLLYWCINSWGGSVSEDGGAAAAEALWVDEISDKWPGEGKLVYPGTPYGFNGPIGTIRIENLREALEDYEYLWLLEKLSGSDQSAAYTEGLYEGVIPATDSAAYHAKRAALLSKIEELNVAANGATVVESELPVLPCEEQMDGGDMLYGASLAYDQNLWKEENGLTYAVDTENTYGEDSIQSWGYHATSTVSNGSVCAQMQMPYAHDFTGCFLSFDAKTNAETVVGLRLHNSGWGNHNDTNVSVTLTAGEWNNYVVDFSKVLLSTADTTDLKFISFYFNFADNTGVARDVYIDNVRLVKAESVDADWIHMYQDTGSSYKNTTTAITADKVRANGSTMSMKVIAPVDTKGLFTFNTEHAVTLGQLSAKPDFTSGKLGAWFWFGERYEAPSVAVQVTSSNWKGSRDAFMDLTYAGDGWYYGVLDTSTITFFDENGDGAPDGTLDGIIRLTFKTPAASTVYVDGISFPNVESVTEVEKPYFEDESADWTNMNSDGVISQDVHLADNSSQSVAVSGAVTFDAQSFMDAGYMDALPNFTEGELSAWFYSAEGVPTASASITDEMGADSSIVGLVDFVISEESVDGWYYGTLDVSEIVFDDMDIEMGATKEAVATITIETTASYIDGMSFTAEAVEPEPTEPEPTVPAEPGEDLLSNATCSATGELQSVEVLNSEEAWKLVPGTGWTYPTFTLDQNYDITGKQLVMSVKPVDVTSMRINLSTIDDQWLSGVTSSDLTVGKWNVVTFDLSSANVGGTAVTSMAKFGMGFDISASGEYAVYIDNVYLVDAESVSDDWINMRIDIGDSTASYGKSIEHLKADGSSVAMMVVAGANDSTWTLSPQAQWGSVDMSTGILGGYFYSPDGVPSVKVRITAASWKGGVTVSLTMLDAGDGWYYGYMDMDDYYFFDEDNDGNVDATAEEIIRIKLTFAANTVTYVDGLMFPTEIPEEFLPEEPTEPESTEPEPTEPETTVPEETVPGEDFFSNATSGVGVLQSETTNGSSSAWKLTPARDPSHTWLYPGFELDKAYDISDHILKFDILITGATSSNLNYSSLNGDWCEADANRINGLAMEQWQTVSFDLSANTLGYTELSKIGFSLNLKSEDDNYAIYIDNALLFAKEDVSEDWINMAVDAGESTSGTYEKVYGFTKDAASGISMKLTPTASESAKVAFNVSHVLGDNYDMSTGKLGAWFYFGEQTPKATLTLSGNWKANVPAAFTFGEGVDGWYFGTVDMDAITFYEEAGTTSDIERVRILIPAGYEPVYMDYLLYNADAATSKVEAETDMLYGASFAYNAANWTEETGLSYGKDVTNVYGNKSTQSWYFSATADAADSGVAQLQLTDIYDATGKVLLLDVKLDAPEGTSADLKIRFHEDGSWADVTTDRTFGIAAGGWTTIELDPNALVVEGKDLTKVRFITFTVNYASNTGVERTMYIDNVRLAQPEDSSIDWVNLGIDAGMSAGTYGLTYEMVKADPSTKSMKITAAADTKAKVTFSIPNVDMNNGTLGAYFYFGDQEPKASAQVTSANWKGSVSLGFAFEDLGDGWYYGTIDTGVYYFYDENGDGKQDGNLDACIKLTVIVPEGYTAYVDGLTYKQNVSTWNISLGDKIGVNFVMNLDSTDVVCVIGDNELATTVTANEDGTYTVSAAVAAAQMTMPITMKVDGETLARTYTVRGYADVILAGDYSEETKTLVKAMLNYGAASQNVFGINTDNLANANIDVTAPAVPTEGGAVTQNGSVTGVSFYGASLLHQNKLSVRFYFAADSIDGLTFKVGETEYAPVAKDGKYYVDVAEIDPQEIADKITVNVSNGSETLSVSYAALDYIIRMYNKADSTDSTKALVQALYGYYLAAVDYLA